MAMAAQTASAAASVKRRHSPQAVEPEHQRLGQPFVIGPRRPRERVRVAVDARHVSGPPDVGAGAQVPEGVALRRHQRRRRGEDDDKQAEGQAVEGDASTELADPPRDPHAPPRPFQSAPGPWRAGALKTAQSASPKRRRQPAAPRAATVGEAAGRNAHRNPPALEQRSIRLPLVLDLARLQQEGDGIRILPAVDEHRPIGREPDQMAPLVVLVVEGTVARLDRPQALGGNGAPAHQLQRKGPGDRDEADPDEPERRQQPQIDQRMVGAGGTRRAAQTNAKVRTQHAARRRNGQGYEGSDVAPGPKRQRGQRERPAKEREGRPVSARERAPARDQRPCEREPAGPEDDAQDVDRPGGNHSVIFTAYDRSVDSSTKR